MAISVYSKKDRTKVDGRGGRGSEGVVGRGGRGGFRTTRTELQIGSTVLR